MARIALDRKTVVCPIIDVISDETFEYVTASDQTWGGFNWKLNFRWYRVPSREMTRRNNDRTAPLRTPTMVRQIIFPMVKKIFKNLTVDKYLKISTVEKYSKKNNRSVL